MKIKAGLKNFLQGSHPFLSKIANKLAFHNSSSSQILIYFYSAINLGDDLFVEILCKRYPQYSFITVAQEEYLSIFQHLENLKIQTCEYNKIQAQTLALAKSVKAVVYIAGSIFNEELDNSYKRAFFKDLVTASKNLFLISTNFGPYTTTEYLNHVKEDVIRRTKGTCFRDSYSFALFKDTKKVSYAPDAVFSSGIKQSGKKAKEIGISLIHQLNRTSILPYYAKYTKKLREVINYFVAKNYKVNLLAFCAKEKDDIACADLLKTVDAKYWENIEVHTYQGKIKEYLALLDKQEFIVATRFHSMILGLMLGAKVTTICYSDKITNVIKDLDLGLSYYCLAEIDKLNIKEIEKTQVVDISNLRKEATRQFHYLDEFLRKKR